MREEKDHFFTTKGKLVIFYYYMVIIWYIMPISSVGNGDEIEQSRKE